MTKFKQNIVLSMLVKLNGIDSIPESIDGVELFYLRDDEWEELREELRLLRIEIHTISIHL